MTRPWDGIISEEEQRAYHAAGFGRATGLGKRPALLIIDVQYRTTGTRPMPLAEAITEYPTSCGEVAWAAVGNIRQLLELFRARGWPVIYPHVAPKQGFDFGRLSDKVPAIMTVGARGYDFVAEIAPIADDILLPKKHPSAFFGTPLVSYLINAGADTLVVTGCTTSGCVRATVVDAFSFGFRVIVAEDCCGDADEGPHRANLTDVGRRYADVVSMADVLQYFGGLGTEAA